MGDQAAAEANVARAKNGKPSESVGVFRASRLFAISGFMELVGRGDKQHGLMMYKLPNTSECFMPMRVAP